MRKLLLLSLLGSVLAGSANDVKPYAEAVKSGSDVFVLCLGSGWMPDADKYQKAFRLAAQTFSGDVVWAIYDRPSGLSPEAANALGKLPCEVFGYPAFIYRDGEGRPLYQKEMIPLGAFQKIGPVVQKLLRQRIERDKLLKAARSMPNGPAKAETFGRALAPLLDPVLSTYSERAIGAYENSVRDIVKEIRLADPNDTDGWALKYSFCYMPIMEGKILKGAYAENMSLTKGYLDKKALLPIQKQMVYAMRFKIELDKAGPEESLGPALKELQAGIALDPKTTIAEAMRKMADYYTKPVMLTDMRWLGKDNRPRWQKAVLDCSSVVKVGGMYKVTFKAQAGGTQFRKVRFAGAEEGSGLKKDVWMCRFAGEGKPVLEMEIKGSGWFDGHGDIIITRE